MENYIKILPDFIANQIAAGEVVQRPESVVKELIENSIDANATNIGIFIKNAGKSLIHIIDNGEGMSETDLMLSIRRHATSKIMSVSDLETIKTFGFRGEALASICSVANVEIKTKRANDTFGYKLLSEPNNNPVIEAVNCDKGTQIIVRNLFFNVPARRKFLKSNLTEFRHISDTVTKIALAYPDIRFTFYDDDNLIFDAQRQEMIERIHVVLGKKYADGIIPFKFENDYISFTGFIGKPSLSAEIRAGMYLYLNKRPIFSPALNNAILRAFEHLLDKNQKPFFIINIEIDYSKVDVNVHPQKHEVKFEDERYIYNLLMNAVANTLSANELAPVFIPDLTGSASPMIRTTSDSDGKRIVVNTITGEIIDNQQIDKSKYKNYPGHIDRYANQEKDWKSAFDAIFSKRESSDRQLQLDTNQHIIELGKSLQFDNKFIISAIGDAIIIIDQHRASKKIIFEKIKKSLNSASKKAVQNLIFPIAISVSPGEKNLIRKISKELNDIGFDFETDDDIIYINSIPQHLSKGKESIVFKEMLSELSSDQTENSSLTFDTVLMKFSSKSALQAGDSISEAECEQLVKDLFSCDNPLYTADGIKVGTIIKSSEILPKLIEIF